jgi:hypothetical protein
VTRSIEELEAELAEARKAEELAARARRDAVKPKWKFTLTPQPAPMDGWDPVFDPTVTAYKLSGEVTNADEVLAAGHSDWAIRGGAMRYLYNTGTERLIGPVGGGTIYLTLSWSTTKRRERAALETAVAAISRFLAEHPEGGDITEIVQAFREVSGDNE